MYASRRKFIFRGTYKKKGIKIKEITAMIIMHYAGWQQKK